MQCGAGSSGPKSDATGVATVDSDGEAVAIYENGNGDPVELGPNVQQSIVTANQPREARLRNGSTANQRSGRYGVRSSHFFVNRTVVTYATTGCGPRDHCCTTTFTGAVDDGFWDVTDLPLVGGLFCSKPDGMERNCEWEDHKPYPFVPFSWTIEYDNPKRKKKQ